MIDSKAIIDPSAKIGDNVSIGPWTIIGPDVEIGDNCEIASHVVIRGPSKIGKNNKFYQFSTIGDHAFIAGGSLVRKDVPPYVKAAREPLSYVGINSVGLRRRGYTTEKIREIQGIYRLLYQKNYNNSQASAIIEAEMEATPERDEILQFIKNSHRGIMKGYFKSN